MNFSTALRLLSLLTLLTLALAWTPSTPKAPRAADKARISARLASRQMTRQKLINRGTIKRALKPRQSSEPKTYPTCATGSIAGFARFAN